MPHCQKEFAKPPVSSKQKKAEQAAKKAAANAKAEKRDKEDSELWATEKERALELDADQKKEKKLKAAKVNAGNAFKEGEYMAALACYSECIELDPQDHLHWSNRSVVHAKLEVFPEALADAKKCTELKPEFFKGWARVGSAYLGLEQLDEAEAAFQHGLTLSEENELCMEGLKEVEKAKERSPEQEAFEILVKELKALDVDKLRERALEEGLDEDRVELAELSGEDPKEELMGLIIAHKYLVKLICEDLEGLDYEKLAARALEEGMAPEKLAEVTESSSDPAAALKERLVKDLSSDLVDAATMLHAEAEEEDAELNSDEDEDEDDDADIDFEAATEETQLAKGDIFIPGAYIDEKYGELVLPNGTRLGNRKLAMFYKQKARPTNERQLVLRGMIHSSAAIDGLRRRVMARGQNQLYNKNLGLASSLDAKHKHSNALSKHSVYAENKGMRALVHHGYGNGGGGAHYTMAGSKQYNKGNKVKGVVLRHSVQGAKMQAQRQVNKQN